MDSKNQHLPLQRIVEGGFSQIGEWVIDLSGELSLHGEAPKAPGVYAFVVDGWVAYVGVASRSLAKRLYLYGKPGIGQATNIRLNARIKNEINLGQRILVFVATPPDLDWYGWTICGAAGLEAGLLKSFELPWNVRGANLQAGKTNLLSTESGRDTEVSVRHSPKTFRSRYDPLRAYLEQSGSEKVSMSFKQIEGLIGPLPKSAYLHQAWWGNHEGNVQAKGWMGARYLVEANPSRRSVVFRKFRY